MDTTQKQPCHSRKIVSGLITAAVALTLEVFLWGFTVDDAWIISRVASHGAVSGLFAFNPTGPVTDAVTPWGMAHIVGYAGRAVGLSTPLELWSLARWWGCVAYGLSFFLAGYFAVAGTSSRAWWNAPCLTVLCLPAAIWAGAGMTAPLVGLMVLLGALWLERGAWGYAVLLLGSAGAWRPELAPFAMALLVSRAAFARESVFKRLTLAGALAVPSALLMVIRFVNYGHALPLSSIAKQPDFQSGLFYAAMTALWAGIPWLLWLRPVGPGRRREQLIPWLVHLTALVFVGGDWMPGLRLSAALFPWLVWQLAPRLTKRWHLGVFAACAVFPVILFVQQGEDLRAVSTRRFALIEAARPLLSEARVVAGVDIGWLGVATEAQVVDLAGVTDPKIAALPGGHTSKAVYPGLFSGRNVDTWVIRTVDSGYQQSHPVESIQASYWVDARLLRRAADLGMRIHAFLPLAGTSGGYVVLRLTSLDP